MSNLTYRGNGYATEGRSFDREINTELCYRGVSYNKKINSLELIRRKTNRVARLRGAQLAFARSAKGNAIA